MGGKKPRFVKGVSMFEMADATRATVNLSLFLSMSAVALWNFAGWVGARKRAREMANYADSLLTILDKRGDIDAPKIRQDYIDACRLIAIHRDGRLNVFTFVRGDDTWSIETMGLLSDKPQEWCARAFPNQVIPEQSAD